MMVVFVSQCEKKAINKTRRVLDAFANRIGERTWQTIITEDGLIAVKKLLRRTVTKNTAVACHWMRSRIRSELVWVVGNRYKFNTQGVVPVNSTHKNHIKNEWENDWFYLPIIKSLVAVSALLHDWGKASVLFQKKLQKRAKQGDPLRHEWISCLLLNGLVQLSGDSSKDDGWLNLLINNNINEKCLMELVGKNSEKPLDHLPPLAQLVAWLIVTHHRLPNLCDEKNRKDKHGRETKTIQDMLGQITAEWGYQNKYDEDEYDKRLKDCFRFEHGLLNISDGWRKAIIKWASRLKDAMGQAEELIENGAWRVVLHHARLCLMLGDHYYSSCEADLKWKSKTRLYANTQRKNDKTQLKQKLDEHLVRVSEQALKISQNLARFTTKMETADVKSLNQKSPKNYEWQDIAVAKIKFFKSENESIVSKKSGWFIVNMASTGCGKTIANAKIMRALSQDGDGLRYILALGLRTLTLQTGDEYRNKIGLEKEDLAVLIGSSVIQELHNQSVNREENVTTEELGSESMEQLLNEDLDSDELVNADFLDAVIPKHNVKQANKNKAFLYKPVLVCTIDHIIAATETKRGGKYILPCLRLLSSDLVIDEVDDFDGKDLIAIGRLIHLAGMLGRKVMISSATIPPSVAEGFFNVYQEGWRLYALFKHISAQIFCGWVDEFSTKVHLIDKNKSLDICKQYVSWHQKFTNKRVDKLRQQVIKRKGYIVRCDEIYREPDALTNKKLSNEQRYFEKILRNTICLHHKHHTVDKITGKRVSFGVVRMANILPCIQLAKYLMSADWPESIMPKVMAYHSRQVLLLRHEQEKHLDEVLKRKETIEDMPQAFSNPNIRKYLNNTAAEDVLFILVATPIEEVGRDHDFDWAVIEPSSYRSIIQLAGRVRRHRQSGIEEPNIAVMQYNLRALRRDGRAAYLRPGYETQKSHKLQTHDLCELLDEGALNHAINAIPRISLPDLLQPDRSLADLEHKVIGDSLTHYGNKGPQCMQSWLTECWWLTALPQQFNRFREHTAEERQLYLIWQDDKGKAEFCERSEDGTFIPLTNFSSCVIKDENISDNIRKHLWLDRNYEMSLRQQCDSKSEVCDVEMEQKEMKKKSERYGELTLPIIEDSTFIYSDQFGLGRD